MKEAGGSARRWTAFGLAGYIAVFNASGCASSNRCQNLFPLKQGLVEQRLDVLEHMKKSNVRIVGEGIDGRHTGAGTIIGTKLNGNVTRTQILTAWHLVKGMTTLKVRNEEKEADVVKVNYAPGPIDLAIVEVTGNFGLAVELGKERTWLGMDVAVIGSPLGCDDAITTGQITGGFHVTGYISGSQSVDIEVLSTSATVNPGSSGGGIFDLRTGMLLGVIVQRSEGQGYAISSLVLEDLPLKDWPEMNLGK